jgi:hypothetical protein
MGFVPSGLRALRESVSTPRASGLHVGFQACKPPDPVETSEQMRVQRKLYCPSPGRMEAGEPEGEDLAWGVWRVK